MKFNNVFAIRKAAASMDTDMRCRDFTIRPSQAALLWWGVKHLENDINDAIAHSAGTDDYPEALRDFAEAIEWCRQLRTELGRYAHENQLETSP